MRVVPSVSVCFPALLWPVEPPFVWLQPGERGVCMPGCMLVRGAPVAPLEEVQMVVVMPVHPFAALWM